MGTEVCIVSDAAKAITCQNTYFECEIIRNLNENEMPHHRNPSKCYLYRRNLYVRVPCPCFKQLGDADFIFFSRLWKSRLHYH